MPITRRSPGAFQRRTAVTGPRRTLRSGIAVATFGLVFMPAVRAAESIRTVSIVSEATPGRAVQHGINQLEDALRAQGWMVDHASSPAAAPGRHLILVGTAGNPGATLQEREAVAAWRSLVAAAGDRYTFDLAMGAPRHDLCGHWRDLATGMPYIIVNVARE